MFEFKVFGAVKSFEKGTSNAAQIIYVSTVQRSVLTSTQGRNVTPKVRLAPRGELCPLGAKLSARG
jgi:hypothetical protein